MTEGDGELTNPAPEKKEMESRETILKKITIATTFIFLLAGGMFILLRYGVGALWGSGSDLGVFASPFVAIFGILAWLWFLNFAVKVIKAIK